MNAHAETQSISVEYDLPHPPAKVWRTLTEPELLAKWIMVNDMRPLVGHRFAFKAQPTQLGGTRLTLEHSGFLPANKFAFDGAGEGWQRMVGEALPEVLAAL